MNKDKLLRIIDKLLKTMSSKREGIIAETSPLDEWTDGWTDCYYERQEKILRNLILQMDMR